MCREDGIPGALKGCEQTIRVPTASPTEGAAKPSEPHSRRLSCVPAEHTETCILQIALPMALGSETLAHLAVATAVLAETVGLADQA